LPAHPLMYARLANVGKHVGQIVHSDFGKNISAINIPDVLSRNNFSPKDIRDFQIWQKEVLEFWQNPLIKKFLGRDRGGCLPG